MTLLEQLKKNNHFSQSEEIIVQYILQHQHEIADITIDELSKKSYTSHATIIRLCKKLGFKGYRQFKLHLIKELESSKFLVDTVDFNTPFNGLENANEIIVKMASLYKDSIDLCLQRIDSKMIETFAKVMMNSQRIFIYATGDTMLTAKSFSNKLLKLNIYPILACETHEDIASSYNATTKDCALFMSYDMKSPRFIECLHILKSKGVQILTVTANEESLLTKNSHYKLIVAKKETNYKIATFYSQFVFEFILNNIYSMIYSYDYQKNQDHKQQLDLLNKKI